MTAFCTFLALCLIAWGVYHAGCQLGLFFDAWQRADDFNDIHSTEQPQ